MDSESTRLLWDLRAALLKAMTESRDMRQALDRLREFGWSAYVVIDEAPDETGTEVDADVAPLSAPALVEGDPPAWNGADSTFLRSLGIDPEPEPPGA